MAQAAAIGAGIGFGFGGPFGGAIGAAIGLRIGLAAGYAAMGLGDEQSHDSPFNNPALPSPSGATAAPSDIGAGGVLQNEAGDGSGEAPRGAGKGDASEADSYGDAPLGLETDKDGKLKGTVPNSVPATAGLKELERARDVVKGSVAQREVEQRYHSGIDRERDLGHEKRMQQERSYLDKVNRAIERRSQ